MADGYAALTDKEKQTLRLLLDGHDAKSMARHFGLSVHTINERLRDARRKLSASSSREAARLLRDAEATAPQSLGDNGIGDAATAPADQESGPAGAGSNRLAAWTIGGLAMISLALAALALSGAPEAAPNRAQAPAPQSTAGPVAESGAAQAARQWLVLVDAGKWRESWAGTARSFQSMNTVETWQSVSETARVPLGRVLSRTVVSDESIPAPPNGLQLVRFRTDFANKQGATETLSLAREGERWSVAGYYIE